MTVPQEGLLVQPQEDVEYIQSEGNTYQGNFGISAHESGSSPVERRDSFCSLPRPIRREVMFAPTETSRINSPNMNCRRGSMEGSDRSSSLATTVITSAVSSCGTDPWTTSGFVQDEEDDVDADCEEDSADANGEEDREILLEPKLEPMDDDTIMADVKEASRPPLPSSTSPTPPIKRPRGRPRKHPLPDPNAISKVAKGRSKTGCITCRRRKKKCDETKPSCMNCEKNSFLCEGYPTKTVWKSGKEKAEEARIRRASFSHVKLEPVIHGVETAEDKVFFEHYSKLSSVFTVEGEARNAFKDMLLPLAVKHLGLMHSILALSSKHIDYDSPYGHHLLETHNSTDLEKLHKRSEYHEAQAMKELRAGTAQDDNNDNVLISARFGQMLCLVLQTLSDPNPSGQHRLHLQAYQNLIQQSPPKPGPFLDFITEFFQYHIALDELIYLPRLNLTPTHPPLTYTYDWDPLPSANPYTAHLLGVSDGLFRYLTQITSLRNKIRQNTLDDIDPIVDYTSLYAAAEIDAGIRDWTPIYAPSNSSRDLAGLLYRQMMWVYLWRTIYPPKTTSWKPDKRIIQAVDDGVEMLMEIPGNHPIQALMLAPAFVLGCAAFEKGQRGNIRRAVGRVREFSRFRNSGTALRVLEEVWSLMDEKDERSWDWQGVANGLRLDFLAT